MSESSLIEEGREEIRVERGNRPFLGNYIPFLPDELVESKIWPLVAESPASLFQLRRANRWWRALIDDSYEWNYLLFRYGPAEVAFVDDSLLAPKLEINRSRYSSWSTLWGEEDRQVTQFLDSSNRRSEQ